MKISEHKYFELLKGKIVEVMQKSYPGISDSISDWKGQNITDFQHELHTKQNQHISEKWFYTHMKSNHSTLPRIDILNFLSEYAGYKNWEEFKLEHTIADLSATTKKTRRFYYLTPFVLFVTVLLFYFVFKSFYSQEYMFCFYDGVTKMPVANQIIEISIISKNESPQNYLCNNEGCFSIKTNKSKIQFVVESPYYYADTIVRKLTSFKRSENIKLQLDNYAVMIHYFSVSNVDDWLKRREDLNEMISDNARIFQVIEGTIGMELYNKWEFINKLSLPTNSLQNVHIIDSKYDGKKITHLRFVQRENE